MAEKKITELQEISTVDADTSYLVVDNGIQTYKIKPINVPGLPRTPATSLDVAVSEGPTLSEWFAFGYAYADKNLLWKFNFNIDLILVATTDNYWELAIAGVLFLDATDQYVGIGSSSANLNNFIATTIPNTNRIVVRIQNGSPGDYSKISIYGDVYIQEMPEWADPSMFTRAEGFFSGGGDGVTSWNGLTGDVTASTSDLPEGSRPYFTVARARSAAVEDAIVSGVADRAPSQKAVDTALTAKQSISAKNLPGGYAGLDGSGKLALSTIPASILGATTYMGSWNAASGIYPSGAAKGQYWIASSAGTISGTAYAIKDWMVYNGSSWDRVSGAGSEVASVNGQQGVVVLDSDNIDEGSGNLYFTTDRARGAAVADSLTDGVTNIAPSQNAVYDAIQTLSASTTASLADKEDLSAKGSNNGYAPLDSSAKVPLVNLPDISGGLKPVSVKTSSGTVLSKTAEPINPSGGAVVRTLGSIATDDAFVIYDVSGVCNPTNYIRITPGGSDKFLWKGVAITDSIVIRRPYAWIRGNKEAGSDTWKLELQTIAVPQPATSTSSGSVSMNNGAKTSVTGEYAEASVTINGANLSGGSGSISLVRNGKSVNLVFKSLTHTSSSSITSSVGVIPADFRPSGTLTFVCVVTSVYIHQVVIFSDGSFRLDYRDQAFSLSAQTGTGVNIPVSYSTL